MPLRSYTVLTKSYPIRKTGSLNYLSRLWGLVVPYSDIGDKNPEPKKMKTYREIDADRSERENTKLRD